MTTAASWRARSAPISSITCCSAAMSSADGRLVEHEQRRAAGDRARDQHALALAARQIAQLAAREVGGVDLFERGARGVAIGAARQADEAARPLPAHQHELGDRDREDRVERALLRHVAHAQAGRALDAPRDRRLQPQQRAHERRLAGAVGADDRPQLAGRDRRGDRRQDAALVVADAQLDGAQQRGAGLRRSPSLLPRARLRRRAPESPPPARGRSPRCGRCTSRGRASCPGSAPAWRRSGWRSTRRRSTDTSAPAGSPPPCASSSR